MAKPTLTTRMQEVEDWQDKATEVFNLAVETIEQLRVRVEGLEQPKGELSELGQAISKCGERIWREGKNWIRSRSNRTTSYRYTKS